MPARSAGLLLYRLVQGELEVLLVHPGGPYWAGRDDGAWSVPKGECATDDDPLDVATREFREELGSEPPVARPPVFLGEVRQRGGKLVLAWAVEGDLDVATVSSNTFTMEWPPRSGAIAEFPEVDRAGWFDLGEARRKLVSAQAAFIDRLWDVLQSGGPTPARG